MKFLFILRRLLRIEQWYKNLLIFAPLFFAAPDRVHSVYGLIIGFFGFSFVSSVTYIINDYVDRKKDRLHPTKKFRPLASGEVTGKAAFFICLALILLAGISVYYLGLFFGMIVLIYFVSTNAYSFGLKNIPILDILLISFNFTLRMVSGMKSCPDFGMIPYFSLLFGLLVIFLTHKRRSDIKLLGEKAASHKPVLKFYTSRNAYFLRIIGYFTVLISLYLLWSASYSIFGIIAFMVFLTVTSIIFSEKPDFTIKPHYLFKILLWDFILIEFIVIMAYLVFLD